MQRLRLTFARGEELKYVSHLDLARVWERAIRRARLPIAYSAGFTPHVRISFALPLAVGVTASAELVDVYLTEPLPAAEARARLAQQLPSGLAVTEATEVDVAAPSLQSQVRAAEYVVSFDEEVAGLAGLVDALLAAEQLPYERRRERKAKTVDLRPFIASLAVVEAGGRAGLALRLRMEPSGSARPDEVLDALGLAGRAAHIHRARLLLAE